MAKRTAQFDLFDDVPAPVVGARGNVYVGTCSWADPSLIKCHRFYPKGCGPEQRLRFYATRFPAVEIDSSFYAMPDPAHTATWAEQTPDGFQFNIKPFRLLSGHQTPPGAFPADIQRVLPPLSGRKKNFYYQDVPAEIRDELWRRFALAIAPLEAAGKLKAVHLQMAPWVTNISEWREHIEGCVERLRGRLVAVEFRNRTWFEEEQIDSTLAWERKLGIVHVVVDEPQQVGNFAHEVWAIANPALAIVRLHGRNAQTWRGKGLSASSERFNYEYQDPELAEIAAHIERLAEAAIELQVLVNVNYEDQGVKAARRLQMLLRKLDPAMIPPE